MCGGHGPWSPFVLVSARLVFTIVLAIGGPWVVGGDGAHLSMCVDGGGGRCRSNVVVAGSTSELANAPSSFVGPEVSGCLLCGRSGAFWVVVGSRHSWVAVVGFLVDGRLSWVTGDRLRMVRVVARGRRHHLGPFMAGGRPGAVIVGRPGLLAMVW